MYAELKSIVEKVLFIFLICFPSVIFAQQSETELINRADQLFEQKQYNEALENALKSSPTSEEQLQGFYVLHATLNNQLNLAKAINLLSVEEILNEYGT